MKTKTVEIERVFNAPVELIWQAITEKESMKQWYFDVNDFKPEIGFEFQFYGQGLKGETYLHNCKVIELEPLKKLKHSWTYEGHEGYSTVTFELFDEGKNQTKLKFTHEGLETFQLNNPDFAKDNFVNGWTHIINTALKDFLKSKE